MDVKRQVRGVISVQRHIEDVSNNFLSIEKNSKEHFEKLTSKGTITQMEHDSSLGILRQNLQQIC